MSAWGPLDNLLRAYGDLQARLQTAEADLAAAREREQRLVKALSWYADEDNYDENHAPGRDAFYGWTFDLGARARAAIGAAAPSAVAQKPRGEGA